MQEGAADAAPPYGKLADTARQAIDPTPGRTLKWLFVALVAAAGFIGLVWLAVRLF